MVKNIYWVILVSLSLILLIPHDVYAITITAVPQHTSFGPNDPIKIDLTIEGYLGGPIDWIANRPDKSTFSGSIDNLQGGKKTHQILRNAFDNDFGDWTIDYAYKGAKQTVSFKVEPIVLSMTLDKELYYDGEVMQINITTSYYQPDAFKAPFYHLNIYNKKGNLVYGLEEISIKAYKHSTLYEFLIDDLVRDNPIGDYKIKLQYYNMFVETPFKVGDIEKRMQIFVGTDKLRYTVGESVELDLVFSKVKESQGVIEITNPLGNTIINTFPVNSVHTRLLLEKIAAIQGKYNFIIDYAGATQKGSFFVEPSASPESDMILELSLDKQSYRPGEIINAKVHISDLIADSLSFWFEDPNGKEGLKTSLPITSSDTVIPHKISKDDINGVWKMHIDYGDATRFAIFFVEEEPIDSTNIVSTEIIAIPKLLMVLESDGTTKFKNPKGIAIDSEDNIYVVDSGNSQIKKFDSEGKLLVSWGSLGTGNGQFKHPAGIFVDKKYVYVADTGNARIQKFDKNGSFVYSWGSYGNEPGMFRTPVALAADASDDLFVSDSGVNKVIIFDSDGKYKDEIRSPLITAAKFSSTNHIVFDTKNNFYIISSKDNKVLYYSGIGEFIRSFGSYGEKIGQFNNPSSIDIDSRGNLYVIDRGNYRIQKFDSQGKFLSSGGSHELFKEPFAIAIDSKNNVYITDKANNNIQKFATYSSPSEIIIPDWIRNNARWWSQGAITDSDFATGIQYMIKQKIISIPQGKSGITGSEVTIPNWIKINAGWWSDKKISDKDFVSGIQHLIDIGIVKI